MRLFAKDLIWTRSLESNLAVGRVLHEYTGKNHSFIYSGRLSSGSNGVFLQCEVILAIPSQIICDSGRDTCQRSISRA